jgi:N-acetyl-1-D-myo-inositol-2-amino-2-deoxy-alpha-D-glucopyranoside deacetylase
MNAQSVNEPTERREPEPLGFGAALLSSVFAAAVGIVVGVITTFTHAQWWPWGLVAGVAVVGALVAGFRLIFDSRAVAASAAAGILAALVLLAFPAPGGLAISLGSDRGILWVLLPVLVSAVVVALPRSRRITT